MKRLCGFETKSDPHAYQRCSVPRAKVSFLKLVGSASNGWTMCYPYGNYNDDTLNILNNRECKLALTTKPAIAGLNEYKRFELPRLDTNEIPTDASAATNCWYDKA